MDYLLFRAWGADFSLSLDAHHLIGLLFQPALFLVTAASIRKPGLATIAIPLNIGFATAVVADRPVLPLLSLAAFVWAIGPEHRAGRAALAGALAGIGALYALEFGTFVLLAELGTLALGRAGWPRNEPLPFQTRAWVLALVFSLSPFLLFLTAVGAIGPFIKTSFIDLPTTAESIWGWPFPAPWELVRGWLAGKPSALGELPIGLGVAKRLYLAPAFAIFGISTYLVLRRRPSTRMQALRVLPTALACLLFFRYVIGRFHLEAGNALTGPLLVSILFSVYTWRVATTTERTRLAIVLAVVGLLAATVMNGPRRFWWILRNAANYEQRSVPRGLVPLSVPRGEGVLVPPAEAQNVAALYAFADAHVPPTEPILDLTNRPGLYFFLNRINPTRFYQVPFMAPFQTEVLHQIREHAPAAVLLETGGRLDAIDGIPNPKRIPRVWKWVEENYPVRAKVGDTVVALPAKPGT